MTKLLVLGLLDGGPMSGYDLQQKLGGADAERWGGVLRLQPSPLLLQG